MVDCNYETKKLSSRKTCPGLPWTHVTPVNIGKETERYAAESSDIFGGPSNYAMYLGLNTR